MFTRVEYKERAKMVLNGNYWTCFIATLLISLITGLGNRVSNRFETQVDIASNAVHFDGSQIIDGLLNAANALLVVLPLALIALVAGILINALLKNVVEVGQAKFFIEAREGNYSLDNLLFGFRNGNFMNQVITLFVRDLYIFVGFLLFIVPGIIALYQYRFVPYILAENPDMHYSEVLSLSSQMTDGIKMDLWILDLSFFGWHLLGTFTLGISEYFLAPYYQATDAEVYADYAMHRSTSEYYYETY